MLAICYDHNIKCSKIDITTTFVSSGLTSIVPTFHSSGINSQGAVELLAMPNNVLNVKLQDQLPGLINNGVVGNSSNTRVGYKECWVGFQTLTWLLDNGSHYINAQLHTNMNKVKSRLEDNWEYVSSDLSY